jgi:hypothetical protein
MKGLIQELTPIHFTIESLLHQNIKFYAYYIFFALKNERFFDYIFSANLVLPRAREFIMS